MRLFVWLIPLMLLAGCTQFDNAKQAAADAQAKLDAAKQEAQEAKDRFDRVKSATVVRNEQLRVSVVPMSDDEEIWFNASAWRGEFLVPSENVTGLPEVRIRWGNANFSCDPQTCRVGNPNGNVTITWADGTAGSVTLVDGIVGCAPENVATSYCRVGDLTRERGTVRVTTAASDVTT
jgi:hypothetical protein